VPIRSHISSFERLISTLSARPEILEAYLFGSQAQGTASAHSDVDVAVFVSASAPGESGFGYDAELGAELQSALGRSDVDVVVLNNAPPALYHRVLRDGERLFARDLHATTTREGQALSRYFDYIPQLKKIDAAHRTRIASGKFGR
jgi:uncharacterized protein